MRKIVAVINDNTGDIYAYLEGYGHRFPHQAWLEADDISEITRLEGRKVFVSIKYGGLELVVNSDNYSFIYEKES